MKSILINNKRYQAGDKHSGFLYFRVISENKRFIYYKIGIIMVFIQKYYALEKGMEDLYENIYKGKVCFKIDAGFGYV